MPRRIIADLMTHDEKMLIYRLAGEGHTLREICKIYNNQTAGPKRGRISTIERVLGQPEAHKFVAKFRMEFLKTIKDLPISEKRVRLDDLEKLRQRLMHIVNNIHLERGPQQVTKLLSVSKRLIEVLDLARNEIEQRPSIGIGIGINQGELSDLSDEELQQQRDDLIRRAARLIERRAAPPDEITDGNEAPEREGSTPVFLASSKKLRRDKMRSGDADVSNVRQQDDND